MSANVRSWQAIVVLKEAAAYCESIMHDENVDAGVRHFYSIRLSHILETIPFLEANLPPHPPEA